MVKQTRNRTIGPYGSSAMGSAATDSKSSVVAAPVAPSLHAVGIFGVQFDRGSEKAVRWVHGYIFVGDS